MEIHDTKLARDYMTGAKTPTEPVLHQDCPRCKTPQIFLPDEIPLGMGAFGKQAKAKGKLNDVFRCDQELPIDDKSEETTPCLAYRGRGNQALPGGVYHDPWTYNRYS